MNELANRTGLVTFGASAALAAALSMPGIVLGQSLKEQIVGTWRTASIYNEAGGTKMHLYGEKPAGLTVFDRSGNYISYLSKPDLPKFAIANRLKGTDAEYRAVVQGMVAGYGTYTVQGDTVTIKWIASSYPNRAGTTEKRTYKVSGDEMTSVNPSAAAGGTSYSKLVRMK
jgi:Lipocalin-like domain